MGLSFPKVKGNIVCLLHIPYLVLATIGADCFPHTKLFS